MDDKKERDDQRDAEVIRQIVIAIAAWQRSPDHAPNLRPLREAIWFYWQGPRVKGTGRRKKYLGMARWSPAARHAYEDDTNARLVLEHVEPLQLIMTDWLSSPPANSTDMATALADRLITVVVTPEEDKQLAKAGLRTKMPDDWKPGDDRWARYRKIGLDPAAFQPVQQADGLSNAFVSDD